MEMSWTHRSDTWKEWRGRAGFLALNQIGMLPGRYGDCTDQHSKGPKDSGPDPYRGTFSIKLHLIS